MNNGFWASIKYITEVAKDTFAVTFSCDEYPFVFSPGQYVWIVLQDLISEDPKGNRRAFSIVSSTATPHIFTILFRSGTSGYKKTLLHLTKEEKVRVYGPFGSAFTIDGNVQKNLVMISGGVGIAPFLGILNSLNSLSYKPHMSLVNFNARPESQIFPQQIAKLCSDGHIDLMDIIGPAHIASVLDISNMKDASFFICGPQPMVDIVYQDLKKYQISDEQMVFEEIYPCSTKSIKL